MLTRVVIEDYQAIREARLKLGRLTVVTGPTGSGKSAVVRALRHAAFNSRGTSYVRHGAKICRVMLQDDAGASVMLQRGARGQDAYLVDVLGETKTLQKLAGAVPEQVQQLLALSPVNFAGQHDLPFLLADSGSQVARTLGELTNVTLVFDAAREANRRKLELARELKLHEGTAWRLALEAARFRTLKARRDAWFEARERMDCCDYITDVLARLNALCRQLAQHDGAVAELEAGLAETELPGTVRLDELRERHGRLRTLYAQHCEADQATRNWAKVAAAAARDEEQAHAALHSALVAAGTCPTCGQSVGE